MQTSSDNGVYATPTIPIYCNIIPIGRRVKNPAREQNSNKQRQHTNVAFFWHTLKSSPKSGEMSTPCPVYQAMLSIVSCLKLAMPSSYWSGSSMSRPRESKYTRLVLAFFALTANSLRQ